MKRIFSFLLAALLLVSAVPMAQATNDYTAGTKVEYTAANNEAYTITVPAQLAPGGNGTVTLSGTWADNRIVTVTADPTVTLKNSIKETDTKTLNVNFDGGISEKGSNTTSQTFTKSISVDGITDALFGIWSGKFNYNVELETINSSDETNELGLYFGVPYVAHLNGRNNAEGELEPVNPVVWIVNEDGSARQLQNGIERTYPAGSFTEESIAESGITIINDGKQIIMDDTTYTKYSMEDLAIQDLECVYDGYNTINFYVSPIVSIIKDVNIEVIEATGTIEFWQEYDDRGVPCWLSNSWPFYDQPGHYADPGTYTIKVTVEDYFGNVRTDTITFDVIE